MDYEKALEKARSAYGTGAYDDATLEFIFPQLKESEDERIRNLIYCLIRDRSDNGKLLEYNGVSVNEALEWLEKQKEASKAIEAIERIDKFIDEYLANAHDMKDSDPDKKYYLGWDAALGNMSGILQDVYSGEKQKEQKPAEVDESTKRLNDNWMKQHFDDYEEQQPAEWSGEDEKVIDTIVSVLGQYVDYKAVSGTGSEYATPRYSKEIDWLKSLLPQNKIHYWTEEEIEPIISDYLTGKEHYGGMIARLRCLKPKSHWKPSKDEECKNSK